MNVVDSSAWLEYFANGPNASFLATAIEGTEELMAPALCLLEVFKRVLQQRDEDAALKAVGVMHQGSVIPATAREHGATLWTQDADFKGMSGVRYRKRRPGRA